MTLTLRVPAFDVNINPELLSLLWPKWVADLEVIFITLEITDSLVKREVLLHYGGKNIQTIYNDLREDDDGYIETVEKISLYFEPDKNRTISVYRFRRLQQDRNETIDQYIVRLCIAAKMCEFRNEDEEVKNQLILSCISNSVRNVALADESVSIPDLMKIARMTEKIGGDEYVEKGRYIENKENEDEQMNKNEEEFKDSENENEYPKNEIEPYNGDNGDHMDQMINHKSSTNNKCQNCGAQYPSVRKIKLSYTSRKISYKHRNGSFRGGNKRKKRYIRSNNGSSSNSNNDSGDNEYNIPKPRKSGRIKVSHYEEQRVRKKAKRTPSGSRKESGILVERRSKQNISEQYSPELLTSESLPEKLSMLLPPEQQLQLQDTRPRPNTWENILIHIEGPVSNNEYFLVVLDESSRYVIVETIETMDVKKIILCIDKIFSEFGIPVIVKSAEDGPFKTNEYEKYARYMGFELQLIAQQGGPSNILNLDDDLILILRELIELVNSGKNNWKREIFTLLRNYRTTPHWETGVAPVELMFEKRTFRTRCRKFKHIANNKSAALQEYNKTQKEDITDADNDDLEQKHCADIKVGDVVLLKFKLKKSLSPVYSPVPFSVVFKWGNMITARCQNHFVTRHVYFFKKISTRKSQSCYRSSDDVSSDDSTMTKFKQKTSTLTTKEIIANLETRCYSLNSEESDILHTMNLLKSLVENA